MAINGIEMKTVETVFFNAILRLNSKMRLIRCAEEIVNEASISTLKTQQTAYLVRMYSPIALSVIMLET